MSERIRAQLGPAARDGVIVAILALAAGLLAGAEALVAVALVGAAVSGALIHTGSTPKVSKRDSRRAART